MNNKKDKTIVLVHGLGLGAWIFEESYVPYFQSLGYEVKVVELPEHTPESSNLARQQVSVDYCVEHVKQECQSIKGDFVLVGMSLGGAICQHIASQKDVSDNLKGVVLLSSVPPVSGLIFSLRMCQRLAKSHQQVLCDFFSSKKNERLLFAPHSLERLPSEQVTEYLEKILSNFSLLQYEVFFQDLFKFPVKINVPLCVIGGEDDMLFQPEVNRFIGNYYGVKPHILPKLGHMIPIEPENNNSLQVIEQFLREKI
ncbi:hypothetical protein A7985_22725 [Pseudoalteromonas luteoviolacea]|uniref:AB hydrolase-1 domain-containing protein n=1 Tax=Pseudoalteromonas luteoviolacea TaxID=43657 RepID=A0A1C0TK61_9GAMM|nr:alpha/beta fold hydrolase [Pseudoalteromonas luteoviolacea]MBQ4813843.1 alpha/beta fold hydrolase [Pseudoalteromonas luteoviolacea]OCQ18833.1 hypothetical protein A7985_22725 [Pseudoalteromonas luteoviolacea]